MVRLTPICFRITKKKEVIPLTPDGPHIILMEKVESWSGLKGRALSHDGRRHSRVIANDDLSEAKLNAFRQYVDSTTYGLALAKSHPQDGAVSIDPFGDNLNMTTFQLQTKLKF